MSILESLQREIADQLSADSFFAHIPVLVESLGDLTSEIARALGPVTEVGGKSGAVVIVTTPTADASWPDVGGPFFDDIPIAILIAVNPLVNNDSGAGTGQSALTIAEQVCEDLHQFFPLSANGPVVPQKPTIVRGPNPEGKENESIIQYLVHFKTMGGLRNPLPQCATPTSLHSGSYTLSCSTPGAAIFYTTDGTNPTPRAASLYSAPLSVSGVTLKARAWLAGFTASETLTVNT